MSEIMYTPLIQGLRTAMLGTTDGDYIDPNSEIPAGEMFRLASEYIESVVMHSASSENRSLMSFAEECAAAPGDPFSELEDYVPGLVAALREAEAKIAFLELTK